MAPRGIRNNNPLNIRKGNNWQGERHPQTDREFEEFATMVDGIRAAMILAYNLITGRARSCHGQPCNTLDKLIARWAPPHENNTGAYLRHVAMAAGITTHELLYPIKKAQFCSQWPAWNAVAASIKTTSIPPMRLHVSFALICLVSVLLTGCRSKKIAVTDITATQSTTTQLATDDQKVTVSQVANDLHIYDTVWIFIPHDTLISKIDNHDHATQIINHRHLVHNNTTRDTVTSSRRDTTTTDTQTRWLQYDYNIPNEIVSKNYTAFYFFVLIFFVLIVVALIVRRI